MGDHPRPRQPRTCTGLRQGASGRIAPRPYRYLLSRIPLAKDSSGNVALRAKHGALRVAQLPGDERGNPLLEALREDDHLGPYVPREVKIKGKKRLTGVPSKENGLDIEGLAVSGDRLFIGMRGPVLRGWAVVLELQVKIDAKGRLKLKQIGPHGQRYRKHFLELDGLGVRELAIDRPDLLILAGPTMSLDGPVAIYRWTGALDGEGERLVPRAALTKVLEVPYGTGSDSGRDHAEGVLLLSGAAASKPEVLIVYDSPADARLVGDFGVHADVFELP